MNILDKRGIQPELRHHLSIFAIGEATLPIGAPVNAVAPAITIDAAVIALLADGDTVSVATNEGAWSFVFDAASVVADGEFRDAVELAALIDALPEFDAVENAGDVDIEATEGGVFYDDTNFEVAYLADTTAGGGAGAPGVAVIDAADIAELAIGDTVSFAGNVFTMAAAPGPAEFVDDAGLEGLLDALADWGAVLAMGDITITSAANGAEWNDYDVDIIYNRALAGGVDGTPGVVGAVCSDGERIYISTETLGLNNDSWIRSDDLNFLTY